VCGCVLIVFRETETRAANLQEQAMNLDVALRNANQRIQQLESNQKSQ
jgi:hypothetical protein